AAPSVDRPHPAPPSNELSGARRPGPVKSFPCVLPPGGRHSLVPKRSPAHVNNRATHPKGDEQLDHSDASQFSSSVVPPRHDSLTGWLGASRRTGTLQLLHAWHRQLPSAVFTGRTAAWIQGVEVDLVHPIEVDVLRCSGL